MTPSKRRFSFFSRKRISRHIDPAYRASSLSKNPQDVPRISPPPTAHREPPPSAAGPSSSTSSSSSLRTAYTLWSSNSIDDDNNASSPSSLPSASPSPVLQPSQTHTKLDVSDISSMTSPASPPPDPSLQQQSSFFSKLPAEIREQIYNEYWRLVGIDRHVYLENGDFRFAPCLVDHELPYDEAQAGIASAFRPHPQAQRHNLWFDRMTSPWCNHWKCEEAVRHKEKEQVTRAASAARTEDEGCHEARRAGGGEQGSSNSGDEGCLALLLSSKLLYHESLPSLYKSTTITVTDKDTLYALFIRPRNHVKSPRNHAVYAFLPHMRTLNISLRRGGPSFLYSHGPALWYLLSPRRYPSLRKINLWVDGEEPVSRNLLPQHRDLWDRIPPEVASILTISFPLSEDGMWSWGEVRRHVVKGTDGRLVGPGVNPAAVKPAQTDEEMGWHNLIEWLPPFEPNFNVVLRGWPGYEAHSGGMVLRNEEKRKGLGSWKRFVLPPGNPYEFMGFHGRGFYDSWYP